MQRLFALFVTSAWLLVTIAGLAAAETMRTCKTPLATSNGKVLPHCEVLSEKAAIHWAIDNDTITLGMQFLTPDAGWVAIGLSQSGSMKGADMFVLTRGANGAWSFTDRHAEGFFDPILDTHNDLVAVPSSIKATASSITGTVRRKLVPCDSNDLPIQLGLAYRVLWAYGKEWGYHGTSNRGSQSVVLRPTTPKTTSAATRSTVLERRPGPEASSTAAVKSFNLTLSEVVIPPVETTYMVQYFKMPTDR